ncbi:MAG TPA: sigma-70 family RNA polymerase sigma factor, partial [Anaerovoracaceae bacterium]|nr:sigma-70 family RNA polymerase sigma factor [Anaerovoracaceae bacterium]
IQSINPDRIRSCNDAVLVSYIARMLHNKKIDLYRNIILKELEETNEEYEFADYSNNDIDERMDWMNYINQLSDKQRSIIIRRYVMEYSDAEIARQFKISRQAICKMKNKALKNLKLIWL